MAFDPALPADSTKLRLAPGVIRDNWVAIQDGETTFKPKAINLNNRTVSGPTDDPAAIADSFILFSKDQSAGNAELFGINESSEIIQFTKGVPSGTTTGISFFPGDGDLTGGAVGAYKVAWGEITMTTSPSATVAPAGFTTVYQYYMTIIGNVANNFAAEDVAANSFRFLRNAGVTATRIKWFAIGI